MSNSIPLPLNSFGEGDDDSYSWTTRLDKGGNQFLLDIMAEWQLHNKSQALKVAVMFMHTYLSEVLEVAGESELSARMETILAFRSARMDAADRMRVIDELRERMQLIDATDHPGLKARLEQTAKQYAALHRLPWPPPDAALVTYDTEARYILERLIVTSNALGKNRVSLRELLARCNWRRRVVVPILERLERHEYVEIEKEKRSGPPTLWITVPTLDARVLQHLEEHADDPF
jgi:hypothetical protein